MKTIAEPLGVAVDENADSVIRELMWGSPGTMLASIWLHEADGGTPWADRFVRDSDLLWQRMTHCAEVGCHLWEQAVYGHRAIHIGAVHGFAGNAFAILRGWDLLAMEPRIRWSSQLRNHFGALHWSRMVWRTGHNRSRCIGQVARRCWCNNAMAPQVW
jgi:hypothetical protein